MILAACVIAAAGARALAPAPVAPPGVAAKPGALRPVASYPAAFFAATGPVTALDMVQRTPGFSLELGRQLRGLAGSAGNVLIDGQAPPSKSDTLEEVLRRIPAAAVLRIELLEGGVTGSVSQGRAILANVVMRPTSGFRGAVTASTTFVYDGRVEPTLRTEASWRWNGRTVELSATAASGVDSLGLGDGPRFRYDPTGATTIRSFVDGESGGKRYAATGAYDTPFVNGRLRLSAAYLRVPGYRVLEDVLILPPGLELQDDAQLKEQVEAAARYSLAATPGLSVEATLFGQTADNVSAAHFEALGLRRDFRLDSRLDEAVAGLKASSRRSAILTLDFGGEIALNRLESRTVLVQNGQNVAVPAGDVEVGERRAEAFISAKWRPTSGITAEATLRQEVSRIASEGDVVLSKSLQFTKPRLTASSSPHAGQLLRARLEREVAQLNFDDFVASPSVANTGVVLAGNPDLVPQQEWVFEAAYEFRFGSGGAAILAFRHADLSDVIDRIPIRGRNGVIADAPGNIGTGTRDEAQLNLTLPLDGLGASRAQVQVQVVRRWSRVTDPAWGRPRQISMLRPVEWEARFVQDLPRLKLAWGADVTGAYRERAFRATEVETRKIGAWANVFAEYKGWPGYVLRVEAQNLLARDFKRIREVYVGSRADDVLAFTDVRDLGFGHMLLMRLRRSF
ncbi:MAG: TonB-dependent receptor [Phenylobacterium sp.]|uniref:TonB-dependent receptor plug domain-containing protein n=1 Tax=Phenylobacterium sp. TaxID=1871053 RepID=UPI00217C399B|nr:TonB-dependent receptor [Phenylobacterium sp.]MCA3260085.1 TonB-dependent receptor [Rubrivivax sp.]MCA3757876.1 TonB-dependent receptor [Phenylobacterium sp.]